jgi:SAM-dependent methyltransferase
MAKQLIAPRITGDDHQPDAFLDLSRDLLNEVALTRDAALVADTRRFLGPYLGARTQQLPRSAQERLDAQILLRRILLARRCYGLVYGWYAAWKFPYGEDAAANLALYIRLLHAALDAYSWVRGYDTVLEVGCGDEALGLMLARYNRRWIASDVRQPDTLHELTSVFAPVGPMEFRLIDGVTLTGVSNGSVDAVVSRSFFEHLLVDDARRHVANAFRALRPGGDFIVYCPAGIGRPSDVTREFPEFDTPLGLHIKEYRVEEMVALLKEAGFGRVRSRFLRLRGLSHLPPAVTRHNQVPTAVASIVEACAQHTWSIARRYRYGGAIWNQIWGHLGATSVFLVARKPARSGGFVR